MSSDNQPKDEEISLANIDQMLAADDPQFTESMEEVRKVEPDPAVVIESSVSAEALSAAADAKDKPLSLFKRIKGGFGRPLNRVRLFLRPRLQRLKTAGRSLAVKAFIFLKTQPKEFALYAWAMLRQGIKMAAIPFIAFRKANRGQKLMALTLVALVVGGSAMLVANLRGVWLPHMTKPVLSSLALYADHVTEYDPEEESEVFYAAFPEDRYEYLFPKIKVNLTPTAENPNPMGAFEVVVKVDSRDSAIEVRDREVEFFDLVQRVFEAETYPDLSSKPGKIKLKARLKREMNEILSQGWVQEVSFKTFVLKP